MRELRISRRRMLMAGTAGAVATLVGPHTVLARDEVERLRWDMVVNILGLVVAGGSVEGLDFTTFDSISISGSGFARPNRREASGGGTYVRRHADSSFADAGVWSITGFNSFTSTGGSLDGSGVNDTIGKLSQTTGGVLSVNIQMLGLVTPVDAALEIHCSLPGGLAGSEGIRLVASQLGLDFKPPERGGGILFGSTLFHALDD